MPTTIKYGSLDGLVGLTFAANALVNVSATLINGSITISSDSPSEVLSYEGLTGTIGSEFIAMKTVTFEVASVSDTNDTIDINAYVGTHLVGELEFTVAGFSGEGIVLAAMPIDSLVTQAGNLAGLGGSLFVLGIDAAGAKATSVAFEIGNAYTFIANAGVHFATAAAPVLQGGNGAEMLIALSGNDTITAGHGKTVIYGGPGNDTLIGGAGKDFIFGGAGTDTIIGGSGADTLTGGSGTDTIYAGSGVSILVGGGGADRFVFAPGHAGGLTTATADSIQHFRPGQGDLIDLSAFDAVLPKGGHLDFIGTAAFDGHAGEVRYAVTSTGVTLECDLTGAGTADVTITLKNIASLAASDFVL
jgi:Ca2+-binding RTX toxin-like protein